MQARLASREAPQPLRGQQTARVRAGELLVFTVGEFDEYRIVAHAKALKDFDVSEYAERLTGEFKYPWGGFVAQLEADGLLERIPHLEFSLHSWDDRRVEAERPSATQTKLD